MANVICNCSAGGGNTGTPSCYGVFDVTIQAILVEYRLADGSINGIDISGLASGGTILDQAYLDGKVKNSDSKARWYPTPALKNIVDERADDIVETFEDSTEIFIQEGSRTFEGFIIKGDPIMLGALQEWRCVEAGVFLIDKSGNLIGDGSRDGFLDPILLEQDSFRAGMVKGTDTTKQKDRIRFTVSSTQNDANLRMIESVSITAALVGVRGLIDVSAETVSGISTTGFTVQLNTRYGGLTTPIPAEGMEASDFEINEVTPTPGAVVITSVTESLTVPGLYTFVIPAATTGDVLRVTNPIGVTLAKNFDLNQFDVAIP